MANQFETPTRPDTAAGAVAQYLRVKTPGAIAAAGASDVAIGTMDSPCTAAGPCTVRLRTAQGTRKMVASEAITAGNAVYAAASGKIAASGTVYEGVALEAATANNDIIEVMFAPNVDVPATAGVTTPIVTFNGLTGANEIRVPDNLADGLSIEGTHGDFIVFTTTNGSEQITVSEATVFTDHVTFSGAIDVTFSGTTGQSEIVLTDNLADALSINGDHGDMITFTTTNGSEAVNMVEQVICTDNLTLSGAVDLIFSGTTGQSEITVVTNLADALSIKDSAGDLIVFTTTTGAQAIAFTPKCTFAGGIVASAVSVTPAADSGAGSLIPVGAVAVDVQAVTNDADDWIVLPAIASVAVGHTIRIACNAGTNFELRTPASSNTKINNVDADGTQEYLCTDTDIVEVTKISDTDGWTAVSRPIAGGVRAAVTPD